jgi:hypothetical protein
MEGQLPEKLIIRTPIVQEVFNQMLYLGGAILSLAFAYGGYQAGHPFLASLFLLLLPLALYGSLYDLRTRNPLIADAEGLDVFLPSLRRRKYRWDEIDTFIPLPMKVGRVIRHRQDLLGIVLKEQSGDPLSVLNASIEGRIEPAYKKYAEQKKLWVGWRHLPHSVTYTAEQLKTYQARVAPTIHS